MNSFSVFVVLLFFVLNSSIQAQKRDQRRPVPPPPTANNDDVINWILGNANVGNVASSIKRLNVCVRVWTNSHWNENEMSGSNLNQCELQIFDIGEMGEDILDFNVGFLFEGNQLCQDTNVCKPVNIPRLGLKKVCKTERVCG